MALSVQFPSTNGLVGPGYVIQIQNTVGPVAVDDYIEVYLSEPSTTNRFTTGNLYTQGSLFVAVLLGFREKPHREGRTGQQPSGANCTLTAELHHANGTLVDFVNDSRVWTWDPVGGLGELVARWAEGGTGSTLLEQILTAVSRTFPVTH